ncbi:MAG: rcc01693 family protein [Pseudomonadota bacterium]
MSGFDWPALMRAGLVGLRMPPEQFWDLTPAELQLMLGPADAARPMLSDGLEALMAAWPDETQKDARE